MLALLGVVPDFPLISYNSTGVLTYDSGSLAFDTEATPLTFKESAVSPTRTITNTPVPSFEIHIQVDNAGNLVGGVPGDDLRVFGDIDIDGDTVVDVSGTLLTGEVMQFGFQNVGTTDFFDFRFKVTGGLLASYFVGKDIAVFNTSEASTFTGSFQVDFRGGAKGSLGAVDALVPGIDIVKSVVHDPMCEADVDGSGVVALFQPNDIATYQYDVTNTGNTDLDITSLQDVNDNGTPGDLGDDIVINPTPIEAGGFNVGDVNTNGEFDPGETWRFEADVLLDTPGHHSNVVTVVATPVDGNGDPIINLDDVTDTDDLRVFVAQAGLNIEKRVNGQDANVEPPTFDHVLVGSTVDYTYLVTNTGNVILDLNNPAVFLDDGGFGPSFTPSAVLSGGFNIGDANQDGLFNPGESWEFEFLNVTLNTVGLNTNVVNITLGAVDINGEAIDEECIPSVSDSDPANIIVDTVGIDLVKEVIDYECLEDITGQGPVPLYDPGDQVTYQYTITTTSTVGLIVDLTDVADNGTPVNPADDIVVDLIIDGVAQPGVNIVGDLDNDNILDVTETWVVTYTTTVSVLGYNLNEATVLGAPVDGEGDPLPGFSNVSAVDDAAVYVAEVGINVEKRVNGADANVPPFDHVLQGSTVDFTYLVTNTGNVILDLPGGLFRDDNATPANLADDFTPSPVLSGGFNIGDADQDGLFDPGESWEFERLNVLVTTLGLRTNIITVTGNPIDANGNRIDPECLPSVTDTDPANIIVDLPGINIVKSVEHDPECEANVDGTGVLALFHSGDTATYRYAITNTGTTDLILDSLQDVNDNGTPGVLGDDLIINPTAIEAGGFNVGDVNTNGEFDPGETWQFEADVTFTNLGKHSNVVTVIASPADGGAPLPGFADLSDTDDLQVFVAQSGINIEKRVNGQDANVEPPPFQHVLPGQSVSYTYFITNTGNVILDFVSLLDDGGPQASFVPNPVLKPNLRNIGDADDDGRFDPGESWEFEKLNVVIDVNTPPGPFTNIVTVVANPVDISGNVIDPECVPQVSDSDPATIIVDAVPSSLAGFVYEDCNNNGIYEPAIELPIPGVTVQLYQNNVLIASTVTDAFGKYLFDNLPAGTYEIREVQPAGYLDGKEGLGAPGVPPGTFVVETFNTISDKFTDIVLPAGVNGASYDFGELDPSSIAGCVYVDVNNNGVKDGSESPIAGVKITLTGTDDRGNVINQNVFTDANGMFIFTNLRPSNGTGYTLVEEHPILFVDGKDHAGTSGGTADAPPPDSDTISGIVLDACEDATDYCFGEFGLKVPSKRPFIYTNGQWQNRVNVLDVNHDGKLTGLDALIVIDALNRLGIGQLPPDNGTGNYPDIDGNGLLEPKDLLQVLNQLKTDTGSAAATSLTTTTSSTGGDTSVARGLLSYSESSESTTSSAGSTSGSSATSTPATYVAEAPVTAGEDDLYRIAVGLAYGEAEDDEDSDLFSLVGV